MICTSSAGVSTTASSAGNTGGDGIELGRSERLSLLRRDSQMHGADLAVPHPGGQGLGDLAGGADQILEVAQRNGPAESTDGGRSILAGLFNRLRIGPSSSF